MKVAIIGAGAMGGVYGFFLARGGHDVVLVDVWKEHVDAINRSGLEMEEGGVSHVARVKATVDAGGAGGADLVLIFVKSYHTAAAAEAAKQIAGPGTLVLTLQNGLGNAETIAEAVGDERAACGINAHGATLLGPGRVSHRGTGETLFGPWNEKVTPQIERVAEAFVEAGLPARVTANPVGAVWGKVMVNVGINALTAILQVPNGALLEYPWSRSLMSAAVKEAAAVAARKGVDLPYEDPVEHCESIAKATGSNRSSMLQDVLGRRRTEVDFINGAVVREGAALGIATPVNSVLTDMVRTIEASYAVRVD
ncbi:MAG TPA: 2-dehydropantoate 2-reductase [Chloroflexota bacterium]